MKEKISAGTIARTIVLALALLNQVLAMCGIQTIPIAEEDVNNLVATTFTIVAALAAWWKNNSFTQSAIQADRQRKEQK